MRNVRSLSIENTKRTLRHTSWHLVVEWRVAGASGELGVPAWPLGIVVAIVRANPLGISRVSSNLTGVATWDIRECPVCRQSNLYRRHLTEARTEQDNETDLLRKTGRSTVAQDLDICIIHVHIILHCLVWGHSYSKLHPNTTESSLFKCDISDVKVQFITPKTGKCNAKQNTIYPSCLFYEQDTASICISTKGSLRKHSIISVCLLSSSACSQRITAASLLEPREKALLVRSKL